MVAATTDEASTVMPRLDLRCRRCGLMRLYLGEAVSLQDVVGDRVPEHDGADLFDASHGQLPEIPVAPAGMDAFADRAGLVLCLAGFAGHARAPGQYTGAVA